MKFTLHYRGPLESGGGSREHKQYIRHYFLKQLTDLWSRSPFVYPNQTERRLREKLLDPCNCKCPSNECCKNCTSVVKRVHDERGQEWKFTSIVSKKHALLAELDLIFLRPKGPEENTEWDIDNRLKTLFDALSIPKKEQIPKDEDPPREGNLFHCVFEDDSLITGVNVKTDRFLNSCSGDEVLIIMCVDISTTRGTFLNLEMVL